MLVDPTLLPPVPTNVTSISGDGAVNISWNPSTGANSYTLKRSENPTGPYTVIASGITSTNYTDKGVINGTTYYYVVSAVNNLGESENSVEISIVPEPLFGDYIYEYNNDGKLTSVILPNGQTIQYEYDQNGNLKRSYIQE
nr:hypothetical protein [Chengkuizengella sediminis]